MKIVLEDEKVIIDGVKYVKEEEYFEGVSVNVIKLLIKDWGISSLSYEYKRPSRIEGGSYPYFVNVKGIIDTEHLLAIKYLIEKGIQKAREEKEKL